MIFKFSLRRDSILAYTLTLENVAIYDMMMNTNVLKTLCQNNLIDLK